MKKLFIPVLVVMVMSALSCSDVGESHVYQGECLRFSVADKVLELKNTQPQLNPIPGQTAVFNLANAKVGLTPAPGDVIRVAYKVEGNSFSALKVMNVSKQDLRKQ
ncbi:MAG: hypothetical protein ABSA52_00755 [Candidatus Binatia bacterium]|jgi:hypothetical protein